MRTDEPSDRVPMRTHLDPAQFEIAHDVPIFDEHGVDEPVFDDEGKVVGLKKIKYTRKVLESIAKNMNRRIADTGDYTALCLGHTPTPEQRKAGMPQPPLVGFAGPYYVGTIGYAKPRPAIIAKNWAIFRDEVDRVRKHPRRSVEVWREENPHDRYIEPIALLGAETPRRDLGLAYSRLNSGVEVSRYTAMAPAANNTYMPGTGKKKGKPVVTRCEEDEVDDYEEPESLDAEGIDPDNTATKARYDEDEDGPINSKGKEFGAWAKAHHNLPGADPEKVAAVQAGKKRSADLAAKVAKGYGKPKGKPKTPDKYAMVPEDEPEVSGFGTNETGPTGASSEPAPPGATEPEPQEPTSGGGGVGSLTDQDINQIVAAISELDFAKWAMEQMEAQQAKAPDTVVDPAMMAGDPNAMGGVPGMEPGVPGMPGAPGLAEAQPGGEMPDMTQGASPIPGGPDASQPPSQDPDMSNETQGNVPENENTHYAADETATGGVDRGYNPATVEHYAMVERMTQLDEYNKALTERLKAIEDRAVQAERYSEIAQWKDHYMLDEEAERGRADKYSAEQWEEHRGIVQEHYARNPVGAGFPISLERQIKPIQSDVKLEANRKTLYSRIHQVAEANLRNNIYKSYAEIEAECRKELGL